MAATSSTRRSRVTLERIAHWLAVAAIGALAWMVYKSFDPPATYFEQGNAVSWEWRAVAATSVVMLPVFAMGLLALSLWYKSGSKRFVLHVPSQLPSEWKDARAGVLANWDYERARYGESLVRIFQNAMFFGALASGALAAALVASNVRGSIWDVHRAALQPAALALVVAVYGAFALYFGRFLIRVSAQDYNARMFSWAFKSLAFVIMAVLACSAVLVRATPPAVTLTYPTAVGIGLLGAIFGEALLTVMLEKVSALIGITLPARKANREILEIDGISEEDYERFAEEGVDSMHALAFVPTARLFFNSNQSLQRIVDWQDQAILRTLVGTHRAKALFDVLSVRGGIDLQGLSMVALGSLGADGTITNGSQKFTAPARDGLKAALQKALSLDGAALDAALLTYAQDELIIRLRIHWQSVPRIEDTEPTPVSASSGATAQGTPPNGTPGQTQAKNQVTAPGAAGGGNPLQAG